MEATKRLLILLDLEDDVKIVLEVAPEEVAPLESIERLNMEQNVTLNVSVQAIVLVRLPATQLPGMWLGTRNTSVLFVRSMKHTYEKKKDAKIEH